MFRHVRERARGERGVVMMFVLLVLLLLAVVTTGVMLFIAADLSAGIRQLHAVRVFNVAEAGLHYAMAELQGPGAATYAGGTVPITDGITGATVGTAQVTVSCVVSGTTLPCTGANPAYRRIVSTGSLPVAGPARAIVAVVEGVPVGSSPYAVCAYQEVMVNQGITIYGDVGSNGDINLLGPSGNYSRVRGDTSVPPYYTGSARAVGMINCSQGCATQVQGTTTPGAPGPVCPTVELPTFSPSITDLTIASPTTSYVMNTTTGYDWQDITVNAAGASGGCSGGFRDLVIQTGAAGSTTVVNVRRLTMQRCTRLILQGTGNVELRVSELTAQGVRLGQYSRLGVLPTDNWTTPLPIPAGRLVVHVQSWAWEAPPPTRPDTPPLPIDNTKPAVQIDRASVVSGAWHVPNGDFKLDQNPGNIGNFYGSLLTWRANIDRDFVFTYDPSAALGGGSYGSFSRLRSWKDQ